MAYTYLMLLGSKVDQQPGSPRGAGEYPGAAAPTHAADPQRLKRPPVYILVWYICGGVDGALPSFQGHNTHITCNLGVNVVGDIVIW